MGESVMTRSAQVVFRCAFGLACVLSSAWLWGCQNGGQAGADAKSSAVAIKDQPASGFKPLDDKNNPYRGEYEEWDRWLVRNCQSVHRGYRSPQAGSSAQQGQMVFTTMIDAAGYVIPALESRRRFEEAQKNRTEKSFDRDCQYITGSGPAEQDLRYRYLSRLDEVCAPYYRRIPGWLGSNPPSAAILLPNGEVVTQGPLGSGKIGGSSSATHASNPLPPNAAGAAGPGAGTGDDQDWFRYSAEGKQLGSTDKPEWWFLYYDAQARGLPPGTMSFRRDGYAIFKDPESGTITSVYDYDGTRLDAIEPPLRDLHQFARLRGYRLRQLYQAQLRLAKPQSPDAS